MTNVAHGEVSTQAPHRWVHRSNASTTLFKPAQATGLLLGSPTADAVVPLSPEDAAAALRLTAETLTAAGVDQRDRVVVALNNDGDLAGARIAEAAAQIAEAAMSVGPRGRMRLLQVLESTRANVLVTTPTGAADLLARLHMEFLVDPLDLEFRLLIVTGEIANDKTYRHLAAEFGATVLELYTEPLTGVPVAHRDTGLGKRIATATPGLLALAALDRDEVIDAGKPGARGEIVALHHWHSELASIALRTGHVAETDDTGALLTPAHTIGDAILVRGRWLSIDALTKALRKIDGITRWQFEVSRKGTLDAATLTVSFNRDSLIRNGMWKSRIEQALTTLTPVKIAVEVDEHIREEPAAPEIIDHRDGQHLGTDRARVQ
ncbi:hypothetical protein ACWDKQ_29060 [Saccharopolyspora sp. NPDC000995]